MTSSGAFWAYSLGVYGRPGFSDLLIRLQDRNGADVNILLYILWRASGGIRLDAAGLAAVETCVRPWRDQVLRPLREIRRAMKPFAANDAEAAALRERVKGNELEAERLQQAAMEACPTPGQRTAPADAARAGLAAYAASLATPFGAGEIEQLLICASIA